jgi:hypothetical protein
MAPTAAAGQCPRLVIPHDIESLCFCPSVKRTTLRRGLRVAYREGRRPGTPLHEVVLVDGKLRGRTVEVVFVESGLRMFVHQARLVCLWSARKTFLRDEARFQRLKADWAEKFDSAIDDAMNTVLKATGEANGTWIGWTDPIPKLQRLWSRAGLEGVPWAHDLAYKGDGYGTLPWDETLRFCLAFCTREPAVVLAVVEQRRLEYEAQARMPGERIYYTFLRAHGPGDALIHQWCGGEQERALVLKEEKRLRHLLSMALSALDAAGDTKSVRRIETALRGR